MEPKPNAFLVLAHSHTSMLHMQQELAGRETIEELILVFFSEGFPFIWPETPLTSAQEAYSPFAVHPNSTVRPTYLMRVSDGRTHFCE